jgi:hypothetical protein
MTLLEAAKNLLEHGNCILMHHKCPEIGPLVEALGAAIAAEEALVHWGWAIQWNSGERIQCDSREQAELGVSLYPGTGHVVELFARAMPDVQEGEKGIKPAEEAAPAREEPWAWGIDSGDWDHPAAFKSRERAEREIGRIPEEYKPSVFPLYRRPALEEPLPAIGGSFSEALAGILNRYSKENGSNTPDFILAKFLECCLAAFDGVTLDRERWYGRSHAPGTDNPAPELAEAKSMTIDCELDEELFDELKNTPGKIQIVEMHKVDPSHPQALTALEREVVEAALKWADCDDRSEDGLHEAIGRLREARGGTP